MAPSSHLPATRSSAWRFVLISAVVLGVFLLCASVVVAAVRTAREAPTVMVQAEATMQGTKVSVRGTGWPARTELTIVGSTPPGGRAPVDLGTAMSDADGAFRATKLTACTSPGPVDPKATVTITVRAGESSADARISAEPWRCMTQ